MSGLVRHHAWQRQRGIAAVELALILPLMLVLLTVPLFFGRVFWHYTVAQKTAHDVVRYMSEIPLNDLRPPRFGYALAIAHDIAKAEMADLAPGPYPMSVGILCNDIPCDGLSTPQTMRVVVRISMFDTIFPEWTSNFVGEDGLLLTADVSMRYVGN